MNKEPLISIVIPTRNRAELLIKRAINSVVNQTYKNVEVIVVDDGSRDNTKELLRPYVEIGKVKYFFQEGRGVSAARNLGVKRSSGDIIVFLDDDDELLPDGLKVVVRAFDSLPQSVGYIAPAIISHDELGNEEISIPPGNWWEGGISGSIAVRRSVFFDAGIWFDEDMRRAEEIEIAARLVGRFERRVVPEPVFRHHVDLSVPKVGPGTVAQEYFEASVAGIRRVFEKHYQVFEAAGRDAIVWLWRARGILCARAGYMKEGRSALWRSFLIKPSLRSLYLFSISLFGRRLFINFLGLKTRIIRWLKIKFKIMLKLLKSLKVVIVELALILSDNRAIRERPTLFWDYFRFGIKRKLYKFFRINCTKEKFFGYEIHFPAYELFHDLWKEIFLKESYFFLAADLAPRILDLGSNIGMSILFFKYLYPDAIITGFEPVASNFRWLKENIETNKLGGVTLINAAVAERPGRIKMFVSSDERYGGVSSRWSDFCPGQEIEVKAVTLSPYLKEEVDCLKVDIEGGEFAVMKEIAGRLAKIKRIVMEVHQRESDKNEGLGEMLEILDRANFRYAVFGSAPSQHQFMKNPRAPYNLILAAVRIDDKSG